MVYCRLWCSKKGTGRKEICLFAINKEKCLSRNPRMWAKEGGEKSAGGLLVYPHTAGSWDLSSKWTLCNLQRLNIKYWYINLQFKDLIDFLVHYAFSFSSGRQSSITFGGSWSSLPLSKRPLPWASGTYRKTPATYFERRGYPRLATKTVSRLPWNKLRPCLACHKYHGIFSFPQYFWLR